MKNIYKKIDSLGNSQFRDDDITETIVAWTKLKIGIINFKTLQNIIVCIFIVQYEAENLIGVKKSEAMSQVRLIF